MTKKGYMEISFGWLFAIIAGAAILIFAIFLSTKIANTGQSSSSAQAQKQIGNLLEVFGSSFESAKSGEIGSTIETRIYNRCDDFGTFGKQLLGVTQQSFRRWPKAPGLSEMSAFQNKYVFSENPVESKKFFVFSKPFETPFKIADLNYIVSKEKQHCWVDAPLRIEKELSNFSVDNFVFKKNVLECPAESLKICFSQGNCDIQISYSSAGDYSLGAVEKNKEITYFYSDSLMYAGIFSSKEVYECNLKRILSRANSLTKIYLRKSNLNSYLLCENAEFILTLDEFQKLLTDFADSSDFNKQEGIVKTSEKLKRFDELEQEQCKLW